MIKQARFDETCPHCGRRWVGFGSWIGFLRLPVDNHIFKCETRTPAQRRVVNGRDERRWAKNRRGKMARNDDRVFTNNPKHPGLKG